MTETPPLRTPLGARFWFLVAGLSLAAVDVSIMDTLLPDIVRQLNISVADASLVDAITVTVAGALMVPAGKLADLIGAKRVLMIGLVILVAASLTTGMATGLGVLIAARIGQGIAFAMVLTTVIAILNRDYPQGLARARAFSLFFASSVGALGLAPLIGALVGEYGSWRLAFLVNAPLAAAVVVGVYRFTPWLPVAGSTRSFDLLGSVLFVFAMGLILFAIQQGSRYGWLWSQEGITFLGRPWTLALSPTPVMLGLSAVLLTAFMPLERWRAERRLDVVLDTQLFRVRSYVWATIAMSTVVSAAVGALLVTSLYAEYILGASAITAGLMVAPMGAAVLVAGPVRGWLARFSGKTVSVIGMSGQLIAVLILIAAFSLESIPFVIGGAMFLLGVAWTVGMSAMTSLALANVTTELTAEAAGIQTAARYLICGFAMVVITTLLMSVAAFGVQKVSFTGLTGSDRTTLDAVEQLKRPALLRVLSDATDPAQRKEFEHYNQALSTTRRAIDEGTRAAGIIIALMLAIGLIAATRLPAQPAPRPPAKL
jgi:MFS family permease